MTADKVKFRGQGISGTATAGVTTNIDYKLTEARLLDGVHMILKDHAFGDSVKFQVVDVDNILGYGAGVVLDTFGESWFIVADVQSQGSINLPYSAEVLAGLYVRVAYTSVGVTNVKFQCNLFLHKYMA
jgi:hypothetical protein